MDVICTAGPHDPSFEERYAWESISIVMSGTFQYRTERGRSFMSAGTILLGNSGKPFECSHDHGEGDRCLSFQFDPTFFERLARDAGASTTTFAYGAIPPIRKLAAPATRALLAMHTGAAFEEIAVELASEVIAIAGRDRPGRFSASQANPARIAGVLQQMESRSAEPHGLAGLAEIAGLSPYHFLRTFKRVTGVTPHQWLLRSRLRDAAYRLVITRDSVTDVALDCGFDDLSNFIRSFKSEFGLSPRSYRRTMASPTVVTRS